MLIRNIQASIKRITDFISDKDNEKFIKTNFALINLCGDIVFYANNIIKNRKQFKYVVRIDENNAKKYKIDWPKEYFKYGPIFYGPTIKDNFRYSLENFAFKLCSFKDELARIIDRLGGFYLHDSILKKPIKTSQLWEIFEKSLRLYKHAELIEILGLVTSQNGFGMVVSFRNHFSHQGIFMVDITEDQNKKLQLTFKKNIFDTKPIAENDLLKYYFQSLNDLYAILCILKDFNPKDEIDTKKFIDILISKHRKQ